MTQLNSNDFKDLIDLNNDLSRAIGGASRNMTFLENANASAVASARASSDLQKSIAVATNNTISGLAAFSGQVAQSSSSDWSTLQKTIGVVTGIIGKLGSVLATAGLGPVAGIIVGGLFEGVANAAGEVLKFLTGQFAEAYGNFEKLSETGIVTTFDDLKSTMILTGLNYADIQQAFQKYSTTLGRFGDSALKGREEFNKIAYSSKKMSAEFQKLGIGVREVAEMQLSYINQQQFSGNMQSMSNEQLQQGSKDYILQLDQLSRMTGVSRIELQKQFEDQTRNARYLAGIATKDPAVRRQMDITLARLRAVDPELAEGVQDYFASGIANTEKTRAALAVLPDLEGITAKLNQGGSAIEATAGFVSNAKSYIAENNETIKYANAATPYFVRAGAAFNVATMTEESIRESEEKTRKQQEDALNGSDKQSDQLAASRRNMYEVGINMTALSVNSNIAAKALSWMTKGLLNVGKSLSKFAGVKVPHSIDLREAEMKTNEQLKEKRNSIEEKTNKLAAPDVGPSEKKLLEQNIEREKKEIEALEVKSLKIRAEMARALSNEGRPQDIGANGSGSSNVSNAPMDASDDYSGLNIGGSYPREAVVGGKASKKVIELARLFQAAYPGGVFNAFNDSRRSGKHGAGLAFDYSVPEAFKNPNNDATNTRGAKFRGPSIEGGQKMADFLRSSGASFVLDEYNYPSGGATGGHIHAEVTARVGGIFKGPTTGYQVTLHGEEKVIPLDNEVDEESMQNDEGMNEESSLELIEFFNAFNSTLDNMIDSFKIQLNTEMITRVTGIP